ncbi:hypothetical protein [Amycolatopsis nivea]
MGDPRRAIPRTDAVLGEPRVARAVEVLGGGLVVGRLFVRAAGHG